MERMLNFVARHGRKILMLAAALVHLAFILMFTVKLRPDAIPPPQSAEIFKMADIREFIPPPKAKELPPLAETAAVPIQDNAAAEIIETEKTVEEATSLPETEIEYLPQYKISRMPVVPGEKILSKLKYPVLAARQGIEGIVYLELFIDKTGEIRKINVLKDPGYGFADAAIKALDGIICQPAFANGENVAVIFRYPVRFTVKR